MPGWATFTSWICFILAVFINGKEKSPFGYLRGLAVVPIGLGLLLPMFPLLTVYYPTVLLAASFVLGMAMMRQDLTSRSLVARSLMLPVLAYGVVMVAMWARGIPPVISQSCTQCKSGLKNLATALEMYGQDLKVYPRDLNQLKPDYLKQLPQCLGGSAIDAEARVFFRVRGLELADGYGYRRVGDGFVLWCRSRGYSGHQEEFQPWYDSNEGLHDRVDGWVLKGPEDRRALDDGPPDAVLPTPTPTPR